MILPKVIQDVVDALNEFLWEEVLCDDDNFGQVVGYSINHELKTFQLKVKTDHCGERLYEKSRLSKNFMG